METHTHPIIVCECVYLAPLCMYIFVSQSLLTVTQWSSGLDNMAEQIIVTHLICIDSYSCICIVLILFKI